MNHFVEKSVAAFNANEDLLSGLQCWGLDASMANAHGEEGCAITVCDWQWSPHAQARLQQRGIPRDAADILLDWGTQAHTGINGRETLFFRKRDLQRLAKHLPKEQWLALEKRRHLFAVMAADGAVVTVGFRVRHMSRH